MVPRVVVKSSLCILMGTLVLVACNSPQSDLGSKEDSLLELATPTTFSYTTQGDDEAGDDQSDDEDESCPAVGFRISANHVFTFSPEGAEDQIQVDGNTLPGVSCYFGLRESEDQPGKCRIVYTNDGYYQTDADKCNLTGQSQALIELAAGCEGENYVLEISDIPDPDAGIGGVLDCPTVQKTFPNVTFYPPTLTDVTFPTSDTSYLASENGPSPLGFEYVKKWDIEVVTKAPCEEIKLLQKYAEATKKRMELYEELAGEATSAKDLDQRVQDAMDEYFQNEVDAGTIESVEAPESAGHYDPCVEKKVHVNYFCNGTKIKPPLCGWLDEGFNTHEQTHQDDSAAQDMDTFTYCNEESPAEAKIASRWEVNAYGKQLEVYNQLLEIFRDLFPECFE